MITYTLEYPTAQNDTCVKATSKYNTTYWPYFATDPAKSLTGSWTNNSWVADNGQITNQRFHIDLGSKKLIRRIYYENGHSSGLSTNSGAKNFTIQGSNSAGAFAQLTYATDTDWETIGTYQFEQHSASDAADPKYILINNIVAYRYYALKIANCWGAATYIAIRRLVLQTEDNYTPMFGSNAFLSNFGTI